MSTVRRAKPVFYAPVRAIETDSGSKPPEEEQVVLIEFRTCDGEVLTGHSWWERRESMEGGLDMGDQIVPVRTRLRWSGSAALLGCHVRGAHGAVHRPVPVVRGMRLH